MWMWILILMWMWMCDTFFFFFCNKYSTSLRLTCCSLPFTTPPTPLDEQILMEYFYIPHDHWQWQRYTSSQLNFLSRHNTPPTHPPIYQHDLDRRQRSGTTLFRAPFSLLIWWRRPQCTEKQTQNQKKKTDDEDEGWICQTMKKNKK